MACHAHLAKTFTSIEESFAKSVMSKYAFVYMAQPLLHGAPAFVLACIGTDNKFCAEDVQKRWSYILSECKKRDITVLSFGADKSTAKISKTMNQSSILLVTVYCLCLHNYLMLLEHFVT